ncbi:hypothetical protein N7481_004733 [Penicillium waksmanii]|uniref:uncharacterized protein n=1 Tax=Penicillium waksmanii TaxID=69791 RepID=UPI002549111F|nr:uncharacterized protein N7481_004733 [Penicillium waksmanii]KAJ5989523.1 hypothetical protein N7481_004733 [Penicillium waksmanii]
MDDYAHWAQCGTCDYQFRSQRAADQHMNVLNHWPTFECETCTMEFDSDAARDQHMRAQKHFERYCPDCDQYFMNKNNLRMHLNTYFRAGVKIDSTITFKF